MATAAQAAAIPEEAIAHISEQLRHLAVPVKSLKHDKQNLKLHPDRNLAVIKASLERFGQYLPLVVQRKGMIVRVGNGRLTVAKQLGWKYVAALVVDDDKVDAVSRALLDNRSGELGQWDAARLAAVVAGLRSADESDAVAQAWTADELRLIVAAGSANGDSAATTAPVPIVEDVPPQPPAAPVTRSGDLWLLGEHRLLCGDSTVAADVGRVMGGTVPAIMVTDQPYGVNLDQSWRDDALGAKAMGPGNKALVQNDHRVDWTEAWLLFPGDVCYVWHASRYTDIVMQNLRDAGFEICQQLIWNKSIMVMGRNDYHFKHEPCLYAVRKGKTHGWVGDRKQTTVIEAKSPNHIMAGSDEDKTEHPTQKPVACHAMLKNHAGDVYDPFLGSGTTIIAAEQLSRRCFGLEIAPAYVDVCCLRWQKLTCREPTLEATGQTFSAVRAERAAQEPAAVPHAHATASGTAEP